MVIFPKIIQSKDTTKWYKKTSSKTKHCKDQYLKITHAFSPNSHYGRNTCNGVHSSHLYKNCILTSFSILPLISTIRACPVLFNQFNTLFQTIPTFHNLNAFGYLSLVLFQYILLHFLLAQLFGVSCILIH